MTNVSSDVTSDRGVQRALGIVVLITIAWVIALAFEASGFDTSKGKILACYESPVAALELAAGPQRVQAILDQGNRNDNIGVMDLNTRMDFLFIVLYCSTLWLLADAYITASVWPVLAKLAIVVTGAFDIMENLQLCREFRTVASLAANTVHITRAVSLTKWTGLAFALWFLAVHFWSISGRVAGSSVFLKLLALSTITAAAATTMGLFHNSVIGFASLPFALTLLLAAFRFFPLRREFRAAPTSV